MKLKNARASRAAKIEIRKQVLELVKPAHVFDAFCGDGVMYDLAWKDADSYVGCDTQEWHTEVHFRRFVADNRLVLRSLDISRINVFDFDAYGSPWDQMWILLHRRQWKKDELGAVVLTDGSHMKTTFGSLPIALSQLLEINANGLPRKANNDWLFRAALQKWCSRARVKPLRLFRADGRGSGLGGTKMVYAALVFTGTSGK